MLKPLRLGNRLFPINIIQGPLAGISCEPFRLLTWQYSKPAFTYTEMISCKTILHQPKHIQRRFISKSSHEGPVCFQLASREPKELAEAAKRVTDYGADLIDLNCGCPVKKIRQKKMGSRLLSEPQQLFKLICSLRQSTHLPISVKIRVDASLQDSSNEEITKVLKDSGPDMLVVHGRHWRERYDSPCRYDEIKYFVDAINIPVIGNGDIECIQTMKKMFATGCAGVMLARASLGQPWVIQKLCTEMRNESYNPPSLKKVGALYIEHIIRLSDLLANETKAIIEARKFAKYYARPILKKDEFCEKINKATKLIDVKILCDHYFI